MLELDLQIIELERDNYHIMLEGEFHDGEKCMWIVDTGASKTVLDKNLEDYYQLLDTENADEFQSAGINEGMVDTQVGITGHLRFGKLLVEELKVALIDLSHVNDIYSKYSDYKIAGLLGGDILKKHGAVIDYNKSKMFFFLDR
ncbi:MAG: hypothetical protein A2W90_07175 [Bacteroidetes bacterium GWF2_42_66]|nr:MAG: hypothetical protein A2W92_01485 [Bacteroidetes bacterium GWA2_42_15]OFY02920.1 MAG: hypothetical protein A2W89_24580 [Bacteroidetes bacterium GWE2_42_39]OFY44575.1 MAG: hypothetical protein A2W90_07175 [Bacteroidetes bacterium GWF2_42_66]HBL74865.1 hypothetical protein [Prolixibacteraceae bacterium]HCU62386.1 hypothetical protein [Prolixibacteraceae bacterium]